jgi:hypothetical protein
MTPACSSGTPGRALSSGGWPRCALGHRGRSQGPRSRLGLPGCPAWSWAVPRLQRVLGSRWGPLVTAGIPWGSKHAPQPPLFATGRGSARGLPGGHRGCRVADPGPDNAARRDSSHGSPLPGAAGSTYRHCRAATGTCRRSPSSELAAWVPAAGEHPENH